MMAFRSGFGVVGRGSFLLVSRNPPTSSRKQTALSLIRFSSHRNQPMSTQPKIKESAIQQSDLQEHQNFFKGNELNTFAALESSISKARDALIAQQKPDGHWRYDLEGHILPSSHYCPFLYFIGEEMSSELKMKMGRYIRRQQLTGGGWGFVPGGEMSLSDTVMCYFSLKIIGDSPDAEHMKRAQEAILKAGGIEKCNILTRFYLALCNIIPWSCVPTLPVELILAPSWFPFNLFKVAFWARTSIVPMSVLQRVRRGPRSKYTISLQELFKSKSKEIPRIQRAPHQSLAWFAVFDGLDRLLKATESYIPAKIQKKAINAAEAYCLNRLNGKDGFGSVTPAMSSLIMMLDVLNYAEDHPTRITARKALDDLLYIDKEEAYLTGGFSPVWDTANATNALLETDNSAVEIEKGVSWLRNKQILDTKGDWAFHRPKLRPGGWCFFYNNTDFPDLDDTAAVLSILHRSSIRTGVESDKERIERGTEWILGMETVEGAWASYEPDNSNKLLNNIPFADHTALLDPPTVDVTARCVKFLAQIGKGNSEPAQRGFQFILDEQESNGSWYGRWGVNYVYGTWSALEALSEMGLKHDNPNVNKAVKWLLSVQNSDGGWGEGILSYKEDLKCFVPTCSTASQTAWALLGLTSVGVVEHSAVEAGVAYLVSTQNTQGQWSEAAYTGTGHPNIIYLNYHGYHQYFPLQALAKYRKLKMDKQ